MPRRVLVIGQQGQLGRSLQKLAAQFDGLSLHFTDRSSLDLSDSKGIQHFFESHPPFNAIINAAAYTAVDQAEQEQDLADQINHRAVGQLAQIACEQGSYLIHISTDYVFNGQHFRPYQEDDPVAPQNTYGLTKLLGEQAMKASGCDGAIIRTSWVFSEFGHNFVKTMLRLGQERDELRVIVDQVGSPTSATDLAQLCLQLATTGQQKCETYHFCNQGVCSWFDFAQAIFEMGDVKCRIHPIESKDYPVQAKRPHFSVLNTAKIREEIEIEIPHWRQALNSVLIQLNKNKVM